MSSHQRALAGPRRDPSASTVILVCALIAIPLFLSPYGQNAFRFPKELLLRFAAILLLARAIVWAVTQPRFSGTVLTKPPTVLALSALCVTWALTTTLLSTNRPLSLISMIWVLSCAVFFYGSWLTARSRKLSSIEWIAIPVCITITIYACQQLGFWRPFGIQNSTTYHGSPALLGTPDDVAVYLVPATLTSFALWRAADHRKILHLVVATAAAATVFWTRTLTAVVALVIALLVAAFLVQWKRKQLLVAALIVVAIPFAFPLLRNRFTATVAAARAGDYDQMLAGRALPWVAAVEMVKAHPWTGVGPGCFSWQYFPFRRAAEARMPSLLSARLRESNFGETHNDQLQVAATAGVPGLALLLGALWLLVRCSRGPEENIPEREFSRVLGAPLAAAMFVLTIAQFPLELAAPTTLVLYLAGSIAAWSRQI